MTKKEKVKCEICKKYYRTLESGHPTKTHGITVKEYLNLYPKSKILAKDLENRNDFWSDKDIKILKKYYGLIKASSISKLLIDKKGCSRYCIIKKAQQIGLNAKRNKQANYRTLYYNEDYFDTPNLENCYVAGLFGADASLSGPKQNTIAIVLHKKDEHILHKIKNVTEFTGKITTRRKKYRSLIYSHGQKWESSLYKHWNIAPRKTYNLKPPNNNIIDELAYAYIIGLFDGDGTWICNHDVKFTRKPIFSMNFLGTKEIVNWIKFWITKLVPEDKPINIQKRPGHYAYINCGLRALKIRSKLLEFDLPFRIWRKWV